MKVIYLVIILHLITCNTNSEKSEKRKENEMQCLLLSIALNRQSLLPKDNDEERALNFYNNAFITAITCQDYLNKKDGVK